jgi:hypothetical protein
MRTTVTIDEALYSEVKQLAAREQSSVGSVIEDALRLLLREHNSQSLGELAPLPSVPGKLNYPPGIDPNRTSEILNYLDELDRVERNAGEK